MGAQSARIRLNGLPCHGREAEALRRLGWVRGIALAAVWVLLVPVGIAFLGLTNLIGTSNGWRYSLLTLGPAVPLTWLIVRGTRHWRRWLTASLAVTAFLVIWLPATATPDWYRLAQQVDATPAPPNSVYLGRDLAGNELCFQGCPQLRLYYAVPSAEAAVNWVNDWAAQQGWTRATLDQGARNAGWCKGNFSLLTDSTSDTDVPLVPEREPPVGTERMWVRVGSNCR